MTKGIRCSIVFPIILFFLSSLNAQTMTKKKEFNKLYRPVSVVKRLSYDNFKKIKLLHTAIMNYGGGKEEFDRLVDAYAEASALYFQNKIIESANLFTKNEKEINDVSQKIAMIYKKDTDKLHTETIKMNVKYKIKMSLKGQRPNPSAEKAIGGASFGTQKANDLYIRSRPIQAIYFFRRAKENCFLLYKILEVPLPEKFKKDTIDNQNKVFHSKKKQI